MNAQRTPGPCYLCRNGHVVRQSWRSGLDCWRCKANDRRRVKRAEERAAIAKAAGSAT